MKITIYSDLHLEWDEFEPVNPGSDLLILAGDICVAAPFEKSPASPYHSSGVRFKEFFEWCSSQWDRIVYVPGNHESYHGRIDRTTQVLNDHLGHIKNLSILDDNCVEIGGHLVIGSTLWTDMNKGDPVTEYSVKQAMNDFRLVQYFDGHNYRKFQPFDAMRFHRTSKNFITSAIKEHDSVIVVTHHSPSYLSIAEQYANDYYINGAYHSDLSEVMLDNPQIKLWCHGHTHSSHQYQIGETTVLCNPKGYKNENPKFNPELVFEV